MSGERRDRSGRSPSLLANAGGPAAAPTQVPSNSVKQLDEKVQGILLRLMPGLDLAALERDASLRAALAADSMDILNFVTALHDELGVHVPEKDYAKLDTLNGCIDYLTAAIAAREARPVSA